VLLAATGGLILLSNARRHATDDGGLRPVVEVFLPYSVPTFSFEERGGRTVTREDLLGKVWVIDCIFTRCGGPCPEMTAKMARIHESLRPEDRAVCVTLTVDPNYDTAEVLRTYADRHGASADRWLFLRGSRADTYEFIAGGLRLAMGEDEGDLDHSTRLVLVDRRGKVRGTYVGAGGAAAADFPRLRRDLEAVLREQGP